MTELGLLQRNCNIIGVTGRHGASPDAPYVTKRAILHPMPCFREAGAGGSNPLTPTNYFNSLAKTH